MEPAVVKETTVDRRPLRARLLQLAPRAACARLLALVVDATVINLLFYQMLRSILLQPLGLFSMAEVVVWIAAFVIAVPVLSLLQPWKGLRSIVWIVAQLVAVGAFCLVVAAMAGAQLERGGDSSWLRIEVVKVPLWLGMFVKTCPGFTAAFILAALLLAWRRLATPRSWRVRAVPVVVAIGYWLFVDQTFSIFSNNVDKTYANIFCGPFIVFAILFVVGATVPAYRILPFALHTTLIGLNYMGVIPITQLAPEFAAAASVGSDGVPGAHRYGVTRLFPANDEAPDASFSFLRKMVLSADRAFISYGPTCGIYSVDRDTGLRREFALTGLVRDLNWSPGGRYLWGSNWMTGEFIALDPERMESHCVADVFDYGLTTPWNFLMDGDKVYVSNVTQPILAEITLDADGCRTTLQRSIDFHTTGYTQFTDGAFGLYVDRARNRIYVLVGMLGGKFEIGLVELDLTSFTMIRDLRLAAGTTLVPVRGRDTVLLPSYYDDSIYEVSLPQMALVRRISAAPTITAIEQDEKRGVFYATSRTTGELLVIDDARGEVVRRLAVGAKPEALAFDAAADQLFLGSGRGVFRIELPQFWAEAASRTAG
jgi:hypothetical protein